MMNYTKHKEAEAIEAALDTNCDGKINNKDATGLIWHDKYEHAIKSLK